MSSPLYRKIAVALWALYVLTPVATGLLAYHWLPNESYDESKHELLDSRSEGSWPEDLTKVEVPERWKDERTGEVFTSANFEHHRKQEADRLFFTWFAYGLLGCLFYAYGRFKEEKSSFAHALKRSLLVNFAISVFIYWLT